MGLEILAGLGAGLGAGLSTGGIASTTAAVTAGAFGSTAAGVAATTGAVIGASIVPVGAIAGTATTIASSVGAFDKKPKQPGDPDAEAKRRQAAISGRQGRRSTILTSGRGLADNTLVGRSTTLG